MFFYNYYIYKSFFLKLTCFGSNTVQKKIQKIVFIKKYKKTKTDKIENTITSILIKLSTVTYHSIFFKSFGILILQKYIANITYLNFIHTMDHSYIYLLVLLKK